MALRPITEEELNKISGQTPTTPIPTSTGTFHPSFSSLRVESPSNVKGVVPKVGQTPEKTFGQKLSSGIQKVFPGQKVGQAIGTLGGYLATPEEQKINYDLSAPTPGQVIADVAQGALTIGTGGVATPTTAVSRLAGLGSKKLAQATIPTATTAGKRILQNTAIGAGFGGSGAIAEGEDVRGVAKSTLIGAGAGLGLGLAGEGISAVAKLKPKPEAIMNRVARLTPTDARKFEQLAGKSHGQYLKETGNFGSPEQIIENEAKKFVTSVKDVDDTLAKLPGQFKARPLKTALKELVEREKRVSSPGAPSKDLDRSIFLQKKHNTTGLTMSEINEAKRLYERNVKLEFNKLMSPEGVARSTNVDRALRAWQLDEAKKLGFKNLDVLNKQTQLSKFIVDNLGKQLTGKSGNEAVNLTDWIVLSGGDPTAVSAFLAKRIFSNKGVQSRIAKALTKEAPIGQVKPKLQKLTPTKPVGLPKLGKLPEKSYKDSKLPKLGKVKEQTKREIIPDFNLTGEDANIQNKSIAKYKKDSKKLTDEYIKVHGKVVNTDEARKLFKDVGYRGSNSAAVQEASSAVAKDVWEELLKTRKEPDVLIYAGGSGTGKTSAVKNFFTKEIEEAGAILDGNLSTMKSAQARIQEAVNNGKYPTVIYVYRDPADAWVNGVIKRMRSNPEEGGRIVPLSVFVQNHKGSYEVVKNLVDSKNNGVIYNLKMVDNSLGKGRQSLLGRPKFDSIRYDDNLEQELQNVTKELYEKGTITKTEYEALIK